MTDVDHSGLGAAYLRSHPDTPIQHPAGASCGYCRPDWLTQAIARSLFAAQLAAIEDDMEREHYRMAGNFRVAYAGVAEFRASLSGLGFTISPALSEAATSLEPTVDGEMEWLDPRHRQWSRDNIARHPNAPFPYKAILPLIDALDTLAARLRGPA